jgi:molybdenum cofactor cytidylyltransferase
MTAAIVLAAGLSSRMGRFKLTLPWGDRTVIGQVVGTLEAAGVDEIIVVIGNRADEVTAALAGTTAHPVHNPDYAAGEMLSSIQAGVRAVAARQGLKPPPQADESRLKPAEDAPGVLLCLGDQPQMQAATVQAVLAAGAADDWQQIIIPSHGMRAGHPILLPDWLWPEILECAGTLRDLMAAHRERTRFLIVNTPTILADLDTPEDYAAANVIRDRRGCAPVSRSTRHAPHPSEAINGDPANRPRRTDRLA